MITEHLGKKDKLKQSFVDLVYAVGETNHQSNNATNRKLQTGIWKKYRLSPQASTEKLGQPVREGFTLGSDVPGEIRRGVEVNPEIKWGEEHPRKGAIKSMCKGPEARGNVA